MLHGGFICFSDQCYVTIHLITILILHYYVTSKDITILILHYSVSSFVQIVCRILVIKKFMLYTVNSNYDEVMMYYTK